MTTKVTIENRNENDVWDVSVRVVHPSTGEEGTEIILEAGSSRDFWMSGTSGLKVTEIPHVYEGAEEEDDPATHDGGGTEGGEDGKAQREEADSASEEGDQEEGSSKVESDATEEDVNAEIPYASER